MHGGGYVVGSPVTYHEQCSGFADELGIIVVSVDYRLAPEHPFPAGLEDCYTALRWVHDHADALGVDPARIAVGGDSAGGGLAAALAQLALDRGKVPVCFQLLVYPMLDDRTVLRADHGGTGAFVWSPTSNAFGWTSYLGHPPRHDDDRPYAAPARREDLRGLPPAWIGVGGLDLFHDEDLAYAERLRAAGVECEVTVVAGMYHGADVVSGGSAASTAFRAAGRDALGAALASA
jgi:acetyl esterase/lipase